MTGLTEQQLAEIRTRAEAATEGPWEPYPVYGLTFYGYLRGEYLRGVGDINFGVGEQANADLEFVLAARQDVPMLLDHITALEQQRERRRGRLIALQNDALDMRGALSPNGQACKVPFPLGETLLPAVEWLISRVEELDRAAARDVTVYRASHDSIVIGHYRTAQVAREHCTAYAKREHHGDGEQQLWWREDEDIVDLPDEGVAELIERIGSDPVTPTGYLVTPVSIDAAFDADGDE